MRARKSSGTCSGATSRSNSSFGLTLATTRARLDHLAAFELDAGRAPGLHDHARHRRVACGSSTPRAAHSRRHRLRDRAHAADRVAPLPALAVHLAEHVMQQHVRGAGRVRAREVADHRVESERRLDRRALEPAVEDVARALREEIEQVAPLRQRQRAKRASPPSHASTSDATSRMRALPMFGGVTCSSSRSTVRHAIEHRVVRGQRARRRAARICATSACVAARPPPTLRYAAVRQRQEVRERPLADRRARARASRRSRMTCGSSRLTV